MTNEARFFAGGVMERHWSDQDGAVATMAAKKKPAKKKTTRKPKPKPRVTRSGPGCQSGQKTC